MDASETISALLDDSIYTASTSSLIQKGLPKSREVHAMSLIHGAIAANRFGLGARPGEISDAASDPRGWLKAQIRKDAAVITFDVANTFGLKSAKEVLTERRDAYADAVSMSDATDAVAGDVPSPALTRTVIQQVQRETRQGLQKEIQARAAQGTTTIDPFAERWARFWSNHFTVAARNAQTIGVVGPFEREAIRPNVFGSFAGLLAASTLHPSMLIYLDGNRSVGPSTEPAKQREVGLNENLAREILELHTLGVGSGYTQADIIEFAKSLTGWTVGLSRLPGIEQGIGPRARAGRQVNRMLESKLGESVFLAPLHEPGERLLLGKTYGGQPQLQALAILRDLAAHPATARRIATKLARHFVSDDPPASAVGILEATFVTTGGDLAALARGVIDLDDAWAEKPAKLKTPDELLTSTARAVGPEATYGGDAGAVYDALAQPPFRAPSPAGWPDEAGAWSGADAVMKRLEWANAVSGRMSLSGSPSDFLERCLGPTVSSRTLTTISRAESARQGLTLALMSPEFQRR